MREVQVEVLVRSLRERDIRFRVVGVIIKWWSWMREWVEKSEECTEMPVK